MKTLKTTKLWTVSLRVIGLGVAVIVLMAATQLLMLSFETDPLLAQNTIDSLGNWIRRRPLMGPGVLAGGALALLTVLLLWSWVRMFGTGRRVLTTRHWKGWTKIDRATLEDAMERRLEIIDRRNDVVVRINRRGRVNARLVTPDPSVSGPAQEMRDTIDAQCESRALPCRSGRITSTVPRLLTNRRKVR